MKNTPSIATILPKNNPCATGFAPNALLRWSTLPPKKSHVPARIGRVARTASVNTRLTIRGGDFGSSRKMWWISGLAAYLSGAGGAAGGALASAWIVMSKTFLLKGVDEPKDASTIDALRGLELVRSW
jgi:hypothetical protein